MKIIRRIKIFVLPLLSIVLVCLLIDSALAQCPSLEEVSNSFGKFAASGSQILGVKPTTYTEICEVHVRLKGRTRIFYVGSKGDFFLMGQLYDPLTGRNLTRDTLETITSFSAQEMALLKELTAFSLGNSGKVLYYATDPQCPYCKKGTEILKKLTASGDVRVNFLLFPLDSHKNAKEQSVSAICDNKSLEEFESGYRSDNQCPQGVETVAKTVRLLQEKGITETPTYIFPDRRYHSGLLEEAELLRRLGLNASVSKEDNAKENKK
jgi:thiol:disulfide interchange protein DsbC